MSLIKELNRRNVFRVGVAYVIVAWLLLQVADVILPTFRTPDWVMQAFTFLLILVFPLALIFAWAFEVTPEGIKLEKHVVRDESITRTTGRKLDFVIIAMLVVALGYFGYDKFVLDPDRDAEEIEAAVQVAREEVASTVELQDSAKTIAVLPFLNMSDDPGNEYFSDGISEEVLNLLAKVPELRVISRSSAFSYRGKDITLGQIAEELNVAHILEGSVRKAGNQVRITTQLIEARSDTHLWSETYDRTLDDIFAIQDEIAATVVEQLRVTLLGEAPHVEEVDPEAYALFLQARHLGRQQTAEGLEQSIALFQQALAIDPDYAAAWDWLSIFYTNQAGYGLRPYDEGFSLAREAAEKALAVDPDYARAYRSLAYIAMAYDSDLVAAARHFERALALDPANPIVLADAGTLMRNLGRLDQAIALHQYASAQDPVIPMRHFILGESYLAAGRWDEAVASFRASLRLSPGRIGAHYNLGVALLYKGEARAALAQFDQEEGDEGWRVKGQAMAYYALGQNDRYETKLRELIDRWGEEWPLEVAHVHAYVGDADRVFRWLDLAIEANQEGYYWESVLPFYEPIHGDPRWAAFLERVGSSPEQLDAIEFEVALPK
jgi:TolB-like protein/Tfp pilus assembly protein PilF